MTAGPARMLDQRACWTSADSWTSAHAGPAQTAGPARMLPRFAGEQSLNIRIHACGILSINLVNSFTGNELPPLVERRASPGGVLTRFERPNSQSRKYQPQIWLRKLFFIDKIISSDEYKARLETIILKKCQPASSSAPLAWQPPGDCWFQKYTPGHILSHRRCSLDPTLS